MDLSILAQVAAAAPAEDQSLLSWFMGALGPTYILLLPVAGVFCFILSILIALRGKGPMASAALVLAINAPLMIGFFATVQGALAAYRVIAFSPTAPQPSEMGMAISTSLVTLFVGLLLIAPNYLFAGCIATFRALTAVDPPSERQ